jgi:hypothetical protein
MTFILMGHLWDVVSRTLVQLWIRGEIFLWTHQKCINPHGLQHIGQLQRSKSHRYVFSSSIFSKTKQHDILQTHIIHKMMLKSTSLNITFIFDPYIYSNHAECVCIQITVTMHSSSPYIWIWSLIIDVNDSTMAFKINFRFALCKQWKF